MKKLLLPLILLLFSRSIFVQQKEQTSRPRQKSGYLANGIFQNSHIKIAKRRIVVKISDIAKSIFLGQIYPSGNLYLKAFEIKPKPLWPPVINFAALKPKQKNRNLKIYQAEFVKEINVGNVDSFVDFPKQEKERARVEEFTQEDFFETFDQAPEDENVGLFNLKRTIQTPFAVFAFSKEIGIGEINYLPKNVLRPLTQREKFAVKTAKRKEKLEAKGQDCTTIPAFLDSAKQLLAFKIKGTNYLGRLSYYRDPFCLGHISDIYILDILQNGNLKQSFELNHYEGAI